VKQLGKIVRDVRRVRVTAANRLALEAAYGIAAPTYFERQYVPSRSARHYTSTDGGMARHLLFSCGRNFGIVFSEPRRPRIIARFVARGRGELSRELGSEKIFY
jgi:hypothetical protein